MILKILLIIMLMIPVCCLAYMLQASLAAELMKFIKNEKKQRSADSREPVRDPEGGRYTGWGSVAGTSHKKGHSNAGGVRYNSFESRVRSRQKEREERGSYGSEGMYNPYNDYDPYDDRR